MIRVVYLAWVREAIGRDGENVDPPASVQSVRDLCAILATQSDGHARAFEDLDRLRVAIDLNMANFDAPIVGATEIAFFPPVTGG